MISEREAKRAIVYEWKNWTGKTGAPGDKKAFYELLQAEHPTLLTFKHTGNKWEQVKLWLVGQ
jgi:hypothetical protein